MPLTYVSALLPVTLEKHMCMCALKRHVKRHGHAKGSF